MTSSPEFPKVPRRSRWGLFVIVFIIGACCGATAFSFITREDRRVHENWFVETDTAHILTYLWLLQVMDGKESMELERARQHLAGMIAGFLDSYGSAEDAIAPKGGALTERFEVLKQRNPIVSQAVARIAEVRKENPEIHQWILERTEANREAIKTAKAVAAARAQLDQ